MKSIKDIYQHFIKRYLILTVALFISAICFNLLLKPMNIVAGGTSGLALIVEKVFNVPTSLFITIVYIITFIISYVTLGKKSLFGIFYATVFYPLFVNLTSNITQIIVINYNDMVLLAIFGGILSGISGGLIYKMGFASSGLGVLGPIFNKYFKLSISYSNFIINAIIVLLGGYCFGLESVLCAIILLYLNNYISNKIILSVSFNKAIYISSNKQKEIMAFLYDFYGYKPTIMETIKGKEIIFIVVSTRRYNKIINHLKEIDQDVFYSVSEAYEVSMS